MKAARAIVPLGVLVLAAPGLAAEARLSADLSAGLGYSENPFSSVGADAVSSGFYELAARPRLNIVSARDTLSIGGYGQYQDYFNRYPGTVAYGADLGYRTRLSEALTAAVRLSYDSAIIGSNNIVAGGTNSVFTGIGTTTDGGVGTDAAGGPAAIGSIAQPGLPFVIPGAGSDLALFGSRDRRRNLGASGDLSYAISARDSVSVQGFYNVNRYKRLSELGDYESYGGSIGYRRQVSERLALGVNGSLARYEYGGLRGASDVGSIQATVDARLNARWSLNGQLGASFIGGSEFSGSSTTISGSAQLCRKGALDRLCIGGGRQVLPTGFSGTQKQTNVSLSYSRALSPRTSVNADLGYVRSDGNRGFGGNNRYLRADLGASTRLGQRLALNGSVFYRDVSGGSLNRPSDYGGRVGVSYRLGDLR